MILETELPAFHEWIAWAPLLWLAVVGGVAVLGLLFGSLVAVVRHGPVAGLEITGKVLLSSVWDLFNMLPRSLRWLNWLVNKGALPYRVLAVVMLFIVFLGLAFVILDRETPLSLPLIVICSVAVAVVFLVIFFMFVCLVCEFLCMSPRRLGALAWLAVKDSLRRRVLIVFILFLLLLLFAGWFLDPGNEHPLRLYIGFVLTATSYLVLLLMLFLSALSLPTDLKNKTLHTVVTKPVRPSEIVLGRMLGFIALGTLLLVVMGAISYIFVVRGLNHTHDVLPGSLKAVAPGDDPAKGDVPLKGTSSMANGHRHNVLLGPTGNGRLEMAQDHFHRVVAKQEGDKTRYEVGPPEGLRIARVPVYGKLRFIDSQRHEADKGTNVGDEWTYRSYIEGGSLAAGVWSFEGVTPQAFSDQLQLEMTLGVFRTYKGDINKGIPGVLLLRNPKSGLTVETKIFESREFSTDVHRFPRKLTPMTAYVLRREEDAEGKVKYVRDELPGAMKSRYDLFDDLTDDGRVEVWLQCLDAMQFFGTAQPDLYLRAQDASFALNFAKGYFGIWMQM
ncbi:MAG TPA: hypothetical protein VJL29_02495, partial [Thermoguttaceae bacterium]|nr:hypothetical protein [Thermoguttaceae bacterium]